MPDYRTYTKAQLLTAQNDPLLTPTDSLAITANLANIDEWETSKELFLDYVDLMEEKLNGASGARTGIDSPPIIPPII